MVTVVTILLLVHLVVVEMVGLQVVPLELPRQQLDIRGLLMLNLLILGGEILVEMEVLMDHFIMQVVVVDLELLVDLLILVFLVDMVVELADREQFIVFLGQMFGMVLVEAAEAVKNHLILQ